MTNTDPPVTRYPDFDTLSRALSSSIAADLRAAIAARGQASLVVSGGRSPVKLFEDLREHVLDWTQVSVRLVDERFAGLKNAAATPALGAAPAWASFASVPQPFDVLVLGMGDDGHTASLFPNSPNLAAGLDPGAAPGCIAMTAPSAPTERLSLNLAALLHSRRIVILLNGESKWRTYIAASQSGPTEHMPVRAVLRQQRTPVDVIWAP
jgi:6-phosphogluconolactonase